MVGFAISRRVFNENPSLPVPLLLFVYLKERKSVWFSRKKIVILSLSRLSFARENPTFIISRT